LSSCQTFYSFIWGFGVFGQKQNASGFLARETEIAREAVEAAIFKSG